MQTIYKNRLFDYCFHMDTPFSMQICGRIYNPESWARYQFYLTNRIHYVISGTVYYQKMRKLKPGYVYLFPANPDFSVAQDPADPVDHIYFDFLSYEKLFIHDFLEIDASSVPGVKPLLESAGETFSSPEGSRRLGPEYFGLLVLLLHDYMPVHQYHSHVTQTAIRCIHESPVSELSVKGVAGRINVNEDHFIRCFRRDTGFTPHRYIALYKTDIATSMISRGATMKEAADELGFSSVSAFSTFYKSMRRVPPSSIKTM
jgi:AraC-like DNA-binding protein